MLEPIGSILVLLTTLFRVCLTVPMKFYSFFILLSLMVLGDLHSQSICDYVKTSNSNTGDELNFYGKNVFHPLSKPQLTIQVATINSGKGGAQFVVKYTDQHAPEYYQDFVKSKFFSKTQLDNSYCILTFDESEIRIGEPISSTVSEEVAYTIIGNVKETSYTGVFIAPIGREQIKNLQSSNLTKILFQLGGMEITYDFSSRKKGQRISDDLNAILNCIPVDSIMDLSAWNTIDLDLTSVDPSNYKNVIVGRWIAQINGSFLVMELDDLSAKFFLNGREYTSGTYRLSTEKFIFINDQKTIVSSLIDFFQDMILIQEGDQVITYRRMN